jgi:hypothetical protein
MTKPQLLALRDLGATLVGAVIGGLAINYAASEFTITQIISALAMAAMIYCIYMLYTIRVSQYEYQEKLNKAVDDLHK